MKVAHRRQLNGRVRTKLAPQCPFEPGAPTSSLFRDILDLWS